MVSVIAPIIAVRLSPQASVFSTLGILLVDHLKVVDTFSRGTSFVYARRYDAFVAESLELYLFNFWSYIVLLTSVPLKRDDLNISY